MEEFIRFAFVLFLKKHSDLGCYHGLLDAKFNGKNFPFRSWFFEKNFHWGKPWKTGEFVTVFYFKPSTKPINQFNTIANQIYRKSPTHSSSITLEGFFAHKKRVFKEEKTQKRQYFIHNDCLKWAIVFRTFQIH